MLHGMFVPITDELNRYTLSVRNLPAGRYEIIAGGKPIGTWSGTDLSRGINIASATTDPWQPGGPWDAQGHTLKVFTDMRDELNQAQRGMSDNLHSHPQLESLQTETTNLEQNIVALQRSMARPVPIKFVIRAVSK
jgi:hypothetical protein